MKRAFFAVVFCTLSLLLAGAAAPQQPSNLQAGFDSLVAAERAFAKLSEAKGIKESFLANIADDAVIFRPDPVPGKQWLTEHPNPGAFLTWHPVYAEIARSGDLGWTTGPYEITVKEEKGYGQYSTVWRKQADGHWKFVADLGIETPAPAPEGTPKRVSPEAVSGKPTAAREAVLAADRDLEAKAAAQGLATAYANTATDSTYLLRDGHQPFVGKAAVGTALSGDPGGVTWEAQGGGISAAGDLGYTYGTATRKAPEESGAYMRVWQRQPGGGWKLALDVVKLVGKKPDKP
jgi:ketosteroid isomerase-like protein